MSYSGLQWVVRWEPRYEILPGGGACSGWCAAGPPNTDIVRRCREVVSTPYPSTFSTFITMRDGTCGEKRPSWEPETHKVRPGGSHLPLHASLMVHHRSIWIHRRLPTVSNIPPAGRDARASRSPSAYPPETTHCRRGARASLSAYPAVAPPVDEAPARASAGVPPGVGVCVGGARAGLYGRRPRGRGRATPL